MLKYLKHFWNFFFRFKMCFIQKILRIRNISLELIYISTPDLNQNIGTHSGQNFQCPFYLKPIILLYLFICYLFFLQVNKMQYISPLYWAKVSSSIVTLNFPANILSLMCCSGRRRWATRYAIQFLTIISTNHSPHHTFLLIYTYIYASSYIPTRHTCESEFKICVRRRRRRGGSMMIRTRSALNMES